MTRRAATTLLALAVIIVACFGLLSLTLRKIAPRLPGPTMPPAVPLTPLQAKIVGGAKAQIGNVYDASYCVLAYPDGAPPPGRGACTDVVVRSLRAGGFDLQRLSMKT